nr:hypothetical protein [Kibdelosporangium sp. MJ126-NF4]CEL16413.1 hypothetical protein; Hypothetical protein [Kibdelosporangium sp. MJ126-NF4]CTQ90365.1 hypothetical protein; Hypothetical protein [Kibdelosporangium sp. MJ126-NF4]
MVITQSGPDLRLAGDAIAVWAAARRPRSAEFPYRPVLDYYQCTGRTAADPELAARLRGTLARLEQARHLAPWTSPEDWLLLRWLRAAALDRGMTYDDYTGHDLLAVVDSAAGGTEDGLVAALLVDLAVREFAHAEDATARGRVSAVLRAVTRLDDFAPVGPRGATAVADLAAALDRRDPARLRDAVAGVAAVTDAETAPLARRAVDVTLMPMTALHDEVMFLRCIQLFERLFVQVVRGVLEATDAVRRDRVDEAVVLLDAASRALGGAASPLYRVLTTMPPDSFAVIRAHTHGASAIQSRSYRLVERATAARADEGGSLPDWVVDTTLQEEFLVGADRRPAGDTRRLEHAMRRLDSRWRAMKRTHWGVTLKIIGTAPGTGGTTGADYLRAAAEVPLFPLLGEGDR